MSYVKGIFQKFVLILVIPVFFSCSDTPVSEQEQIVLSVNEFTMTRNEFLTQCAVDMEYKEVFKTSRAAKEDMVNGIIRKELLLQEASKMGLDRDPEFMSAIERYWEATLIKMLMEQKSRQIHKTTLVSSQDINKQYEAYRQKNKSLPPLAKIEKEIAAQILEEKKARIIEEWVASLRENAEINVDDSILTE